MGRAMGFSRIVTCIVMALACALPPAFAQDHRIATADGARSRLDSLIARHAAANNVPEDLIRRVIRRESGGNPRAVHAGNYGLMQIKLPTARAVGYTGNAAGLLDADTNMTYAVKYLAGAYKAAQGNANRAVHYYASGYYYVAKRKGLRMPNADQRMDSFASTARSPHFKYGSVRDARANGQSISSATSLYGGRPDYY